MEGEVYNLVVDLVIVLASLVYSHSVAKLIAPGPTRLLAIFPVICFFIYVPLTFNTMFLSGLTSFSITWLGSFKLILFAFGQGPLYFSGSPQPLHYFIPTAWFPIKILHTQNSKFLESQCRETISKNTQKSPFVYVTRTILFLILVKIYDYKDRVHPILTCAMYAYYLFYVLELFLALTAHVTRALINVELEPQFDEPHHATSVQNFWGKRWNLMVSSILRQTVYYPARSLFAHVVPKKWVSVPAVFATFLVSGVIHELIFYYLGRFAPTWEITLCFIIQGLWVGIEIVAKKTIGHNFQPPSAVTRPLTMAFVMVTTFWLFFPPYLRFSPHSRACREVMALIEFFKHGHLLSPDECQCPYKAPERH